MESSPEFKTLEALMGDENPGIDRTIKTIVELTRDAAQRAQADDPRALEDHLWNLWSSVFEFAARNYPANQSKLVAFTSQLRDEKVLSPSTNEPLKHEDGVVWAGLPAIGWVAREQWNFNVLDPQMTEHDLGRRHNQTSFLAKLTALPRADESNHLDFTLYALWAFRDAFETSTEQPPRAAIYDVCLWLLYAADQILPAIKEERSFPDKTGAAGDKFQGKDWTGFQRERFVVWHQGLKDAQPAEPGRLRSAIVDARAIIQKGLDFA